MSPAATNDAITMNTGWRIQGFGNIMYHLDRESNGTNYYLCIEIIKSGTKPNLRMPTGNHHQYLKNIGTKSQTTEEKQIWWLNLFLPY